MSSLNPTVPSLLALLVMAAPACGPAPLPPELARPAPCPELSAEQAVTLAGQAMAELTAGGGDALDDGLDDAALLRSCHPELPALASLEAALGEDAVARATTLADAGQHEAARHLLARVAGPLDLGEAQRQHELSWAALHRDAAESDHAAGRLASATLRRELALWLSGLPEDALASDAAAAEFAASGPVTVELALSPPEPALQARLLAALGPGLRWVDDGAQAELRATVELGEGACDEREAVSIAQRPARDPARTRALQERELAEGALREVEAALETAASTDSALREVDALLALDEPGRRQRAVIARPEVQAVIAARAAVEALDPVPPEPPPFSYEIRTVTRSCQRAAVLQVADSEIPLTLEASAAARDTAHPAFLEQDLDEDPLTFDASLAQLGERTDAALAAQIDAALHEALVERVLLPAAVLSAADAGADQLERITRAVLLLGAVGAEEYAELMPALLSEGYGVADPDAVSRP